jgi:hypothetical protein
MRRFFALDYIGSSCNFVIYSWVKGINTAVTLSQDVEQSWEMCKQRIKKK